MNTSSSTSVNYYDGIKGHSSTYDSGLLQDCLSVEDVKVLGKNYITDMKEAAIKLQDSFEKGDVECLNDDNDCYSDAVIDSSTINLCGCRNFIKKSAATSSAISLVHINPFNLTLFERRKASLKKVYLPFLLIFYIVSLFSLVVVYVFFPGTSVNDQPTDEWGIIMSSCEQYHYLIFHKLLC